MDFGLARNAAFARADRIYPNAELIEIRTDEPHMREVWIKHNSLGSATAAATLVDPTS